MVTFTPKSESELTPFLPVGVSRARRQFVNCQKLGRSAAFARPDGITTADPRLGRFDHPAPALPSPAARAPSERRVD